MTMKSMDGDYFVTPLSAMTKPDFYENRFVNRQGVHSTSGVVTLEDAIETLLGREIVDESDVVEDMQELARGKYRERLRQDKNNQDKNEKGEITNNSDV